MKKLKRWILIIGGLLVLLVVGGLAVVLNSGVQTGVVLRALQKTDPTAKLASVSFGFSGGEVHGLELTTGGALIKLDSAKVQYSLANLLFGATKVIDSATASGLVVDLTAPHPAKSTATPAPAGASKPLPGILIKKADIAGTVILGADRSLELNLSAQDLGSGGDGKATGTVIYHDKSPGAKVTEMRASTQATVSLDAAMMPKNLDCTTDLTATLPGQTQAAQLSAHLLAKPVTAQSGEINLTLAPPGGTALLDFKGTYTTAGAIDGDFNTDLARAQIEPFALGFKLPDFTLRGAGHLSGDAAQHGGSVKADFTASAGNFAVLSPELASLGNLALTANVDVAVSQNATDKTFSIAGKTLNCTLAPQNGQTAISLELLKPATVQYGASGLKLPAGDLARLTLAQMPAAWLSAVMPKPYSATGQGLSGQILLGARDDGALSANTSQPITFSGLDISQAQQPLLVGGVLTFDGAGSYLNHSLQAQVRDFSFAAHTVAFKGVTLTSVSLPGKIVQAKFAGNVSVVPGLPIPQVLATGHCTLALDLDRIDHTALGKNLPALAPGGLLTLDVTVDAATAASATDPKDFSLSVNSLQVALTKGAGATQATFATLTSLQKFSLPLGPDAKLQSFSGNLATLEISNFPLTVAQAFLPPTLEFSGNPLQGKILLVGQPGNEPAIALQTTQPFTIANAQFMQDKTAKLAGVTLTLAPAATWKSGDIQGSAHLQATSTAGALLDAMVGASETNDTLTANVSASGQLSALAAQPLGVEWRSYLPASNPQFSIQAALTRTPKSLTISNAEASVAPAGGTGVALAEIKFSQPFTLTADPAAANKYLWPKASGDVFTAKLNSLPAGVLALALPGYRLQGQQISADVLVHGAGDGNYTLTSNAPITAAGLSLTRLPPNAPAEDIVRNLSFTFKPSATFSNQGVSHGSLQDLLLSFANTPLARGNVDFSCAPGQLYPQQAKVSLQADLAQLLLQPVLARFDNLASGTLKIDGTLDQTGAVSVSASVTNWQVRDSQIQLPQMMFENVTGKYDRATQAVQLNIPVKGQGAEGLTDCTLAAEYGPNGNSHKFSVNLTGASLVIDDLLAVKAGLFPTTPVSNRPPGAPPPAPAPSAAPAANPLAPPVPDKTPIWGDLQGTAKIDLKSMRFHAFSVDNFKVDAQVSPTQAVLSDVGGQFQGAPLTLNATLGFDAKRPDEPYSLATAMDFKSFDVGAFFKSRDAMATPPVEGNFSISGNASGQGANINDVIDKVQFSFKLGSGAGTFHLLDLVPNKTLSSTLKTIANVSGVAGTVLSLLGQKSSVSAKAQIANSVLSLLANLDAFSYTKLDLEAERGPDLTVKLNAFDVQSAEVELMGTGQVKYVRGVAIPDQPLTATLSLNAKGGIAQGLQALHLLGNTTATGYNQGPQFNVAGTMQHPDYQFLYNLFGPAAKTIFGL